MCVCSPETLIKLEELPKINGVHISAIYAYKRNMSYYRLSDANSIDETDFYLCVPYFHKDKPIRISTLPKELADIFGDQHYGSKKVHVTHMWYRTSDSCNGSFTDDSMEIIGGGGRFNIFRGIDDLGIDINSDLAVKMLNTLNKKFTVKECEEWEYMFYPCTHLRTEGGLNYPDLACSGWRREEMPYVTYDNCKNMRVYYPPMNMHVYISKLENNPEIGDEFICLNFNSDYEKSTQFCFINHWGSTKEGAANEIIRYRVDSIDKDKKGFKASAIVNEKPQFKKDFWFGDHLYKIELMKSI